MVAADPLGSIDGPKLGTSAVVVGCDGVGSVGLGATVGRSVALGVEPVEGVAVGFGVGFRVGFGVGTSVGTGVVTGIGAGVVTGVGFGVGTSVGAGVVTGVGVGTVTLQGIENRTANSLLPLAASYARTPMCAHVPRTLARGAGEPMKPISILVVATSSGYVLRPMFSPAILKQKPSLCMKVKTMLLLG